MCVAYDRTCTAKMVNSVNCWPTRAVSTPSSGIIVPFLIALIAAPHAA